MGTYRTAAYAQKRKSLPIGYMRFDYKKPDAPKTISGFRPYWTVGK